MQTLELNDKLANMRNYVGSLLDSVSSPNSRKNLIMISDLLSSDTSKAKIPSNLMQVWDSALNSFKISINSSNKKKLELFSEFFRSNPIGLVVQELYTFVPLSKGSEVSETTYSIYENAHRKAFGIDGDVSSIVIGDDTFINVPIIGNGFPGVISKRIMGKESIDILLKRLEDHDEFLAVPTETLLQVLVEKLQEEVSEGALSIDIANSFFLSEILNTFFADEESISIESGTIHVANIPMFGEVSSIGYHEGVYYDNPLLKVPTFALGILGSGYNNIIKDPSCGLTLSELSNTWLTGNHSNGMSLENLMTELTCRLLRATWSSD